MRSKLILSKYVFKHLPQFPGRWKSFRLECVQHQLKCHCFPGSNCQIDVAAHVNANHRPALVRPVVVVAGASSDAYSVDDFADDDSAKIDRLPRLHHLTSTSTIPVQFQTFLNRTLRMNRWAVHCRPLTPIVDALHATSYYMDTLVVTVAAWWVCRSRVLCYIFRIYSCNVTKQKIN